LLVRRLVTLTVATFAVLSAVPSMAAGAAPVLPGGSGDGQVVVVPGDNGGKYAPPSVDTSVHAPGASRTAGSGLPVSGRAGGGPACSYRRALDWERWVRSMPADGAVPGIPAGQVGDGTDGIDPNSHLYARTCNGVLDYVWIGSGGAQGAAAPSPAVLARDAFSRLVLPLPSARHSPDLRLAGGEPAVLVGEHTWVWVDRVVFSPRRKRVQAGAVWALVTATPVTLRVEPGDGPAVVCDGAGTPFDATRYGLHAASPTCDHVYARSSFGLPEERVTATYEIWWRVTWVGSTGTAPASGSLPDLVSRATTRFAVAEAQALITGGWGR
jgi:hypothetical protein